MQNIPKHNALPATPLAAPAVPLAQSLDALRRAAVTNVHRATQRRRDSWHRSAGSLRLIAVFAAVIATSARAEVHSPFEEASAVQRQMRAVVEHASHSVYAVTAFEDVPSEAAYFNSHLDGAKFASLAETRERSCGSAFAIDADGHLLTNEHVVSKAGSVWVTDDAGHVFPATVIGTDPRTDLAVLSVPTKTLPLSAPDQLSRRGDLVVAIGNPDGLATDGNLAASVGCVSATGRSLAALSAREHRSYTDLIQVTTPIAIGGSGGPLIDLDGEVIGVVCAVATADHDGMPVGFAITLSPATRDRIAKLIRGEEIVHPYFGVSVSLPIAGVDPQEAGARVDKVEADAPANGILREGDIVVSMAGKPITSDRSFIDLAALCDIDQPVSMKIRRDVSLIDLTLRPGRRPLPVAPVTRESQRLAWAGVTFANADEGVRVTAIDASATMPLEVGTTLRRVGGEPVPDLAALTRVLFDRAGEPLALEVASK